MAGVDTVTVGKQKMEATDHAGVATVKGSRDMVQQTVTVADTVTVGKQVLEATVHAGVETGKMGRDMMLQTINTTVNAVADTVESGKQNMDLWMSQHIAILKTPPSVAVLVVTEDVNVATVETPVETPIDAMLRYRARVKWCKQDRELLVFRMVDSEDAAYQQIDKLHQELMKRFESRKPAQGPFLWAVHDYDVCKEVQAHEMLVVQDKGSKPCWWKVLRGLMMITPHFNGDVLSLYREQYGPEVAFQYACCYLHVQHLWGLSAICLVMAIMNIQPKSSSERESDWYKWIVGMTLVWLWFAWSTWQNWRQVGRLEAFSSRNSETLIATTFGPEKGVDTARRRCKAFFCVLPGFAVFCLIFFMVFWLVTSITLSVINNWGKCIERMTRKDPDICRDPTYEHGFLLGTIAEIACDVFLVILLEFLMPLGQLVGEWVADVQNFKYQHDRDFFVSGVMAGLGSFERIGFVGVLAMRFAPQWYDPHDAAAEANWTGDIDDFVDPVEDCSDFILGQHSIGCIRRKLGVNKRRYMFEKLMKGPFIVAPFVAILVKVVIPIIVHIAVYESRRFGAQRKLVGPCRMFWRLAALIFAYDGGNAGCLGFVVNGWPFEVLEILQIHENDQEVSDDVADIEREDADHQNVEYILGQAIRKKYEPVVESFDLKMSKLWIVFFTPIMPVGVLFTTLAQRLKIEFDIAKLLWARTRPLPHSHNMARRSHMAFSYAVLVGSFGWYMGLHLVTYNNDLYMWKIGGDVCFYSFFIWEAITFVTACYYRGSKEI